MRLPGGLWRDGERLRDVAFTAATGTIDLAIAEGAGATGSRAHQVTAVLSLGLEHIGGKAVSDTDVRALPVGDRQYLMRQLGTRLDFNQFWLTATCEHCNAPFDFTVAPAELPVKEADERYPFAEVATSLGRRRFRVPTGGDQEAVAAMGDEGAAVRRLVALCTLDAADAETFAEQITDDDLGVIDRALEEVAPEVATGALATCPDCGGVTEVFVDPAIWLDLGSQAIFDEIHALASHYHWSEADILALPRERRRRYLEMINRDAGMIQ